MEESEENGSEEGMDVEDNEVEGKKRVRGRRWEGKEQEEARGRGG